MEMEKAVYFLAVEGMADWECGLALAELRRTGGHRVMTAGFGRSPITSMGGLRIEVEQDLFEVPRHGMSLLIVPGADLWEQGAYPVARFEARMRELVEAAVPLAAICGATAALARAGVYEGRAHTSNDRGWLGNVAPGYSGAEHYRETLAVRDGTLITASSVGSVEFAREIFSLLEVMPEAQLEIWFHLFKHGRFPDGIDPAQFFAE